MDLRRCDQEQRAVLEKMIENFGQTPTQLFKVDVSRADGKSHILLTVCVTCTTYDDVLYACNAQLTYCTLAPLSYLIPPPLLLPCPSFDPPLLPPYQSAHPQRLSAEDAHRAMKSDIPSGTNPTTFANLFENIENLKAFAVDVSNTSQQSPSTQMQQRLHLNVLPTTSRVTAVHMKCEACVFCVKKRSSSLHYPLAGVRRE